MQAAQLSSRIAELWDRRDLIGAKLPDADRAVITDAINALDSGVSRAAEPTAEGWKAVAWAKQAILLWFRFTAPRLFAESVPDPFAAGPAALFDKVGQKFAGWKEADFVRARIRAVPGAIVRKGAFIGPDVVLMPSFVNIGAYVGAGTMVDTWATIGSCAQIGERCHVSGGAGIGGVLEPLQARPTIIEDGCFIGARAEIAEGVVVEKGAVIAMGCFIGQSTRIIDRATGETFQGRVPAFSVVVPGTMPGKPLPDGTPGPSLACAVIVKRVDATTRAKTSINELLRA